MPRFPSVWTFMLVALLAATSGCDGFGPERPDRLTLHVAPATASCTGVGPRECLLVKEHIGEEWSYSYFDIAGFTYEPAYSYTLPVEWMYIPDPPADGSSVAYRLLRVLERSPAPTA